MMNGAGLSVPAAIAFVWARSQHSGAPSPHNKGGAWGRRRVVGNERGWVCGFYFLATLIFFSALWASAFFGTITVSTPSSKDALILSAWAASGSRKVRSNAP